MTRERHALSGSNEYMGWMGRTDTEYTGISRLAMHRLHTVQPLPLSTPPVPSFVPSIYTQRRKVADGATKEA